MGKRGPKKTPTNILNQRGSWRGKAREGEPMPEVCLPPPPPWLGEKAAAHWPFIGRELEKMGLMSSADTLSLALLCDALADYLFASEMVTKSGGGVARSEKTGGVYQLPFVKMKTNAWERVVKISREFGLSPASRAGLNTSAPEKKDGAILESKERFFA